MLELKGTNVKCSIFLYNNQPYVTCTVLSHTPATNIDKQNTTSILDTQNKGKALDKLIFYLITASI